MKLWIWTVSACPRVTLFLSVVIFQLMETLEKARVWIVVGDVCGWPPYFGHYIPQMCRLSTHHALPQQNRFLVVSRRAIRCPQSRVASFYLSNPRMGGIYFSSKILSFRSWSNGSGLLKCIHIYQYIKTHLVSVVVLVISPTAQMTRFDSVVGPLRT